MDDAVADVLEATMESSARVREAMSRRQIEETIMIAAAEVLVDILECPVYMRNETRATAIQTFLSMGSRWEPPVA